MYNFTIPDHQINKRSSLIDKLSTPFVFTVCFLMTVAALCCVIWYGKNIPLAEDWLLVAPMTGHEPDIMSWLWQQNNEHRIPFPKAVMLALLKLTDGNFKAGMYINVLLLSSLSVGVVVFLRKFRSGYTKYTDAFFPVLLLHIGNWENMVWGWQLSFVLPTVLLLIFFLILINNPLLATVGTALSTGLILILLPLSGGNGLLFVPFLAFWQFYCAWYNWRNSSMKQSRNFISGFLLISSLISVLLCAVYFIGYERVTWNPPSPGIWDTLKTSAKFILMSVGPAVKYSWKIAIVAIIPSFGILAWCLYLVGQATSNKKQLIEKHRAWAVALFLCSLLVFSAAIGWGRAGLVPQFGMPDRYVLFASPLLFVCFFVSEFFESKRYIQVILFLMVCMLIPYNTKAGFVWREWYLKGMTALEVDIAKPMTTLKVAGQNKAFLIRWWDAKKLSEHINMLEEVNSSPFYRPDNEERHK
jgi:hypothetical protein